MTLGFKDCFVPFVRNGSKTHTIRAYGHRRPFRVGDTCHCFAKVRTKEQELIGAWPCVKVERIEILVLAVCWRCRSTACRSRAMKSRVCSGAMASGPGTELPRDWHWSSGKMICRLLVKLSTGHTK